MKSDKRKIDDLIALEKENNIWNHIRTCLLNQGEIIAEKKSKIYFIWVTHMWVSTFYPTVKIRFDRQDNVSNIETELSIFSKVFLGFFLLVALTLLISLILIPIVEDIEYFGLREVAILLFLSGISYSLYWVISKSCNGEKKYLINNLKIAIGLETQENINKQEERKNEWAIKMVLFRLFAYPFSIFVMVFSIFYMLPQGNLKGLMGHPLRGCIYIQT